MRRDDEIDRCIVGLLLDKQKPVPDAEICEHICKSYKKIYPTTYSSHKKKLMSRNIIERFENGVRGAVEYSMTEDAKQLQKIGILRFDSNADGTLSQEEKQLKSFFLVIFHASRNSPGFSVSEILNSKSLEFRHLVFSEAEIQRSMDLLRDYGLLKILTMSDNEMKYVLSDPSIQRFLACCADLYKDLISWVIARWEYISKPTTEERLWLEEIYMKKVDVVAKNSFFERMSFKKKERKEIQLTKEVIEEVLGEIDEKFRALVRSNANITNKYKHLIQPFLEILYPKSMRRSSWSRNVYNNHYDLMYKILSTS